MMRNCFMQQERNAQRTKEGRNRRDKQLQEKVMSGGNKDSYARQRKCMTFNRCTKTKNTSGKKEGDM